MQIQSTSIRNMFEYYGKTTQFIIPIYQRNYDWKEKNVLKLWNDIKKITNKNKEKSSEHYLGSLVYKETKKNEIYERLIIDGQQRLTTIMLILIAIRNKFLVENRTNLIENIYIKHSQKENILKFKQLSDNDQIFKKICKYHSINQFEINEDDEFKNKNLFKNFKLITNEINKDIKDNDELNIILSNIENKLKFALIALENDEDAQEVFDSINSTGLKLNKIDLVRNYILMNLTSDEQMELYHEFWSKIVENIQNEEEELIIFARIFLTIKLRKYLSNEEIYDEFVNYSKSEIFNNKTYYEWNKIILEEMLKYSKYFNQIYISKDINNIINPLKDIIEISGNAKYTDKTNLFLTPAPLLLYLNDLLKSEKINEREFENSLKVLNTYFMRRELNQNNINSTGKQWSLILNNIDSQMKSSNYVKISELIWTSFFKEGIEKNYGSPSDENILETLTTKKMYGSSKRHKIIKLIGLKWINNQSNGWLKTESVSIEHIMPSGHTNVWRKEFINNEDNSFDEHSYDMYSNKIGNLILLKNEINSKASNYEFDSKKEYYKKDHFNNFYESIFDETKWGKVEINNRSKRIANYCNTNLWPYKYEAIINL